MHPSTPRSRSARLGLTVLCLLVAGCSSNPLPSLSTGSLFGSKPDAKAAASTTPEIKNDPTTRTLQVSRLAARAKRCGYNFDAQKLKANFMTSEGSQPGAAVAELGRLDSVYNSAFAGTTKAISKEEDYCSDARNAHIKAELARHLSGDYAPGKPFKDPNAGDDGGLFDGLLSGNGSNSDFHGATLPTDNR